MSKSFQEEFRLALCEEVFRDRKNIIPKSELLKMSEEQLKNELDKLLVGGIR